MLSSAAYLAPNPYPGRGVFLGLSPNGQQAVIAYFIMGRSLNSRNRVFVADGPGLRTQAFDAAKLEDPSLIIYAPVRLHGSSTIVTNGDQTDTIQEALAAGSCFAKALHKRTYEPDAPNFTPRISGILHVEGGRCRYDLSILKKGTGTDCLRFFYEYAEPQPGEGHLLHTYAGDGEPLPSFAGEPVRLATRDDIDAFTAELWQALNEENKVSLFVRYLDLTSGETAERILNRHQGA